jgi:hypothetical protein
MTFTCTGWVILYAQLTCVMPEPPVAPVICPPVRTWSKDFEKQVAAGLRAAPTSALPRLPSSRSVIAISRERVGARGDYTK